MAAGSDSEEDFVGYGTPLEPLEEDEPLRKPVPLHEQTVKDEKGRYQRFHGAFTGGFSAGYFNTVGSKEGWTPSTFVSSRQQKAEKHHARPEDFMDEEDFGEHGIAPREITTSQEFWSGRRDSAAEKARAVNAQSAIIPGDTLLEELIAPARSSIGVELLRGMGWREGQGVGPRVKRRARRQQTEAGGRALPGAGSEDSQGEDNEEFAPENTTFAPKDVTPVDFTPRTGVQGLGYHGLDPGLALVGRGAAEHIDLFRPQSDTRSRLFGDRGSKSRRGGVAGQAFGVGALEDDDEDIYHRDSMSRYDTILDGEEPGDGLYGWTAPQQYTKRTDRSRDVAYVGKILDGFTLAQRRGDATMIFPPPALPRGYRPVHLFCPPVDVLKLSGVSPALAEALKTSRGHMVKEEPYQGGRHQLDSGQRRTLLGEDALQGPSSVMDLLRPEDRRRLLSLRASSAQKTLTPPSLAPPSSAPPSSGLQQHQEALAAWRGASPSPQTFRPFEQNHSKQARYELYLTGLRRGDADALEQSLDASMTEWERSREEEEFVRASILYRPSSSSLSSRFTRAALPEDEDAVEVNRDEEGDVDDKNAAVKMKMFGTMTRETFEWHPDKLLCKRFNVPDPYPGSGLVGLPKVKRDKFSVFNFLTVTESRGPAAPPKPSDSGKKSRWDVTEAKEEKDPPREMEPDPTTGAPGPPAAVSSSQPEVESEKKTEEEQQEQEESRPPMDLFKAIFASSSDEKSSSSSEGGGSEEEGEGDMDSNLNLFKIPSSSTSAVVRSNQPPEAALPVQAPVGGEGEEFGPKLPPPSAAGGGGATSFCKEKSIKRVKNRKHVKQKKDRKKKKHKKHKHRSGEQKKKSRREEDLEDKDGQELDEESQLLRRLKKVRPHPDP